MKNRIVPWMLVIILAILVAYSSQQRWFRSIDAVFYDFVISHSFLSPSNDIIIVEIDDESLSEIGGWPWSRDKHAELLSHLSVASVVVFDIVFPDPQSSIIREAGINSKGKSADEVFSQAIAKHGSVVLPLYINESFELGAPKEVLPIPILGESARQLGHVQIPFDEDGIARSIYLYTGVGEGYWPQLALTVSQLMGDATNEDRNRQITKLNPFEVIEADQRYLRFVGPPNSIARVSYADVVSGSITDDIWRNKKVFVGATAQGMGDYISTPVGYMPGVEFHANVLHSIEQNGFVQRPSLLKTTIALTLLFIVCAALSVRFSPRQFLVSVVVLIVGALVVAVSGLTIFNWWYSVLPFCFGLAVLYPLWSWRRIEMALSFLQQELDDLNRAKPASQAPINTDSIARQFEGLYQAGITRSWRLQPIYGDVAHRWPSYSFRDIDSWSEFRTVFPLNGSEQELFFKTVLSEKQCKKLLVSMLEGVNGSSKGTSDSFELVEQTIRKITEAQSEVEHIQTRMNSSMALLQDAVMLCDLSGGILFKNVAADQLFSKLVLGDSVVSLGEYFAGKTWSSLCFRLLAEGEEIYEELTLSSQTFEKSQDLQQLLDRKILLCQGGKLELDSKSPNGSLLPDYYLFVFTDVSQLRSAERGRREMLAFLSHDMRSPIVSQIATIAKTREDKTLDDNADDVLERLEQFGRKSLKYSEDFLQLTRAETVDKKEFYLVDLHGVIDGAVAEQQGFALQKNIRIKIERCQEDAWVEGDAQLLERAVSNLIGNAVQHSQPKSCISVVLETNPELRISIVDQGAGMSKETIDSLFQPHFRNRSQRRRQSAEGREQYGVNSYGLGLSFVHTVIIRHGGRIVVDSELGQGTEFKLYFNKVDPE